MSKEYQDWQEFQNMEFERKLQGEQQDIEDRNEQFNRAEENYIKSHITKVNHDNDNNTQKLNKVH